MVANTQIKNFMTTKVISVQLNDMMTKVDEIFQDHDFNHLPVLDEHSNVTGIISRNDYHMLCDKMTLLGTQHSKEANTKFFKTLTASEVMTKHVVTLKPTDLAQSAYELLSENKFHAIPIVDESGKLLGIITALDMLALAFNT